MEVFEREACLDLLLLLLAVDALFVLAAADDALEASEARMFCFEEAFLDCWSCAWSELE